MACFKDMHPPTLFARRSYFLPCEYQVDGKFPSYFLVCERVGQTCPCLAVVTQDRENVPRDIGRPVFFVNGGCEI